MNTVSIPAVGDSIREGGHDYMVLAIPENPFLAHIWIEELDVNGYPDEDNSVHEFERFASLTGALAWIEERGTTQQLGPCFVEMMLTTETSKIDIIDVWEN